MLRESTGQQTVNRTLLTTSNVLMLPHVQWTGLKTAGHWLGEAYFRDRPFKPLIERSNRSNQN